MRALVIYESIYGNTHAIASAIGDGLAAAGEVRVVPVGEADAAAIAWADLVVAGGPTHARGMTRGSSRTQAVARAGRPGSPLGIDGAAAGPGIRDWLDGLRRNAGRGSPGPVGTRAEAFDTRVSGPALLTGRASSAIARGLREGGFTVEGAGESFLVDTRNQLVAGELDRARSWGAALGATIAPATAAVTAAARSR